MVDITTEVEKQVKESQAKDGLAFIFVPHSTAAVLLTENEQGLRQDLLETLKKLVSGFDYAHDKIDDNADSHILASLVGQGRTLVVEQGKLIRGTWQQIFLAEFDGPRARKIIVKII